MLRLLAAAVSAAALALQPAPPASFIEGVVKAPDGKPLEGALVLARGTNAWEPADDAVRTDASGRFKIAAGRPASYVLHVEAKGFAARTLERVRPGKPVDVVLQKGAAILGVVLDGRSRDPVAGARVEARPLEAPVVLAMDPSVGAVQAVSDAKGSFKLENVASGLHSLTADARGYGRSQKGGIAAGAQAPVEFLLFPGASIAGVVRGPDRKPVAGAVVRAETQTLLPRSAPPRAEVTSADGRFVVTGVDADTYRLSVRHKDYAPAFVGDVVVETESETRADVSLTAGGRVVGRLLDAERKPLRGRASVSDAEDKSVVRGLRDLLRADADAEGRFQLASVPPGSQVLSLTAPGHAPTRLEVSVRDERDTDTGDVVLEAGLTIRGTVKGKDGAPLADATIFGMKLPGMPVIAEVEADGSFTLSGISPGRYQLHASAPGYGAASHEVEVAAGDGSVELVLSPAGIITGAVVDDAGRPVESFRVRARATEAAGPRVSLPVAPKSFGAADGRFSLEVGAEGPHTLEVTAPDRASASVSGVVVVSGQTVDAGRIRLSSGGSVRGVVVDASGAPVAGATVSVRGVGPTLPFLGPTGPESTSDASGNFDVRGVDAGTIELAARHPSFAEGRSAAVEVDPAKGPAETRIVLMRGGRIEGLARRRDGTGLAGLNVMLVPRESGGPITMPLVTGEDGTFVADHVKAGRVRAMLMGGSLLSLTPLQERDVDVIEGEVTSVPFVVRDIHLSGRITRRGQPAAGLKLKLSGSGFSMPMFSMGPPAAGPQRLAAVTDADGRYEMIANEPGRFRMEASSPDSQLSLPARVVLIPDADAHVADLDYGGTPLGGVVLDKESGQPIANARVLAWVKDRRSGRPDDVTATSGPDGRFQMELEPSEYGLQANAQGYRPKELQLSLGPPGVSDVKFELGRGATLEGRVVDERGRGVAGLEIRAEAPLPERPVPGITPSLSYGWASSRADGSFVVEGLRETPHVLVARAEIGGFAIQTVTPGDSDVTLTLKPGGRLQLQVRGPDGAPIAGVYANVYRVNGIRIPGIRGAETDRRGIAEFPVPAGELEVSASNDKLSATAAVHVPERGTAALELKLSEALRIRRP